MKLIELNNYEVRVIKIIKIERKILNIKINNYYFAKGDVGSDPNVHVKAYSHSFAPRNDLKSLETVQHDLTKSKDDLLMAMHRETRRQIRRAADHSLEHIVIENPSDADLKEFQEFYNHFAENKKTYTCNAFHMKTMKLLREKNGLMLTYMKDQQNQIYCYRVYIIDGELAMNLYSATHFRMVEPSELKKVLSQVNRFLVWKNILTFKDKGYKLYDVGGLTDDKNIRRFKLGFGGEIVHVYSGYEANSIIGALVLQIRNWKMAFATAREIQ